MELVYIKRLDAFYLKGYVLTFFFGSLKDQWILQQIFWISYPEGVQPLLLHGFAFPRSYRAKIFTFLGFPAAKGSQITWFLAKKIQAEILCQEYKERFYHGQIQQAFPTLHFYFFFFPSLPTQPPIFLEYEHSIWLAASVL